MRDERRGLRGEEKRVKSKEMGDENSGREKR